MATSAQTLQALRNSPAGKALIPLGFQPKDQAGGVFNFVDCHGRHVCPVDGGAGPFRLSDPVVVITDLDEEGEEYESLSAYLFKFGG